MKKFLLLLCATACCLSGYAVTLFPSSSTVMAPSGGGSLAITVIASGESNTGTITNVNYLHVVSSSPTSGQFDAYPISGASYHSPAGGPPTTFTFALSVSGTLTQSFVVTYHISTTVYNSTNGTYTYPDLTVTVTINPYTTPPFGNVVESGTYTRNNCSAGLVGSSVTYTVPANTFTSTVSQAAANQLAIDNVTATGQYYANANGTCTAPVYWNVVESGIFATSCGVGKTPSTITYTVAAHTYSSTSQTAANQLAINAVNAGGPGAAAAVTCSCTAPHVVSTILNGGSPTIFVNNSPVAIPPGENHIYFKITGTHSSFTLLTATSPNAAITIADPLVPTDNLGDGTCTLDQEFYATKYGGYPTGSVVIKLQDACGTVYSYTFNFTNP